MNLCYYYSRFNVNRLEFSSRGFFNLFGKDNNLCITIDLIKKF